MMRRGRRSGLLLAGLLAATAAAAGCAQPTPQAGPQPAPAPPTDAAPAVPDARDARAADPCALPTSAQLATLGISGSGARVTAPEGPGCAWRGRAELGITLYTSGGGIATLARNSEPTTSRVRLAGYPALETFTGKGEFCQYDVAVAATQVVSASLQGGSPDSCTALQAVLPGVVANLPGLGG
jgi:uncharacterized protein DUF3558